MTDANPVDVPPSRSWALAQAGIVAVAFSLLLAGTNAVNPLLPVYREELGLEPFVLSLTFVFYVTVLVVALVVLARPSLTRHATGLLLTALAVALGADALLSLSTEWSVLVGRMVAGVAGGLATGAAAALVVAAIGSRGRALSATGNLVGAVVGTAASQLVIELRGSAATHEVFLWHGVAVLVVLVAASVVLRVRRAPNRLALATVAGVPEKLRLRVSDTRYLATGCVAWAGVSVSIVLGATVFAELDSPLVPSIRAGQLASPYLARVVPWMSGMVFLAAGALGIAAGAVLDAPPLALAGFAALGVGIGVSYRAGLVALSRGASPARQGALSSAYGAITYAVAAAVVLTVGAVGNVTGVVPAAVGALVMTAVGGLVLLPFAPRLRDTVDRV